MKLIHLSDLHVSSLGTREGLALRRIVAHIVENHADAVVVITGDLVNDGTPVEFAAVRHLLQPLDDHCPLVMTLPGNHDVKRLGTVGKTDRKPYADFRMEFDRADMIFPFVTEHEDVQIIALDSNGPSLARGSIGYSQRMLLADYLEQSEARTRVVCVHHHPRYRGLGLEMVDASEFIATLSARCDILLYGHKHKSEINRDVYGIGWLVAAGKATDDLSYRVFDIDDGKITFKTESVR